MSTAVVTENTTTFAVDPAHSELGFWVRHLGLTKVRGTFGEMEAVAEMEDDALESLRVSATIQTASVSTNNEDRDKHLRSEDFFDVERFPTISFTSTAVRADADGSIVINGNLTIRDVTRSLTLKGEYVGTSIDPWGNTRIAFSLEGKLNRKDFGLTWNQVLESGGLLVSEDVHLVIDVQAVRQ